MTEQQEQNLIKDVDDIKSKVLFLYFAFFAVIVSVMTIKFASLISGQ
jgi:hypothetical protein